MKTNPKATGQRGSKKTKKDDPLQQAKAKSAKAKKVTDEIWNIARLPAENPNPIMRLTPEGEVLYANDASLELLNSWKQELQQTLPSDLQRQLKETFTVGADRKSV